MYYQCIRTMNLVRCKTIINICCLDTRQSFLRNSFCFSNGCTNSKQSCVTFHNSSKLLVNRSLNEKATHLQEGEHKLDSEIRKFSLATKDLKKKLICYAIIGGVIGGILYTDWDEHLDLGEMQIDSPIPDMTLSVKSIKIMNIFPMVKKIFSILPDGVRQYIGVKMVSAHISKSIFGHKDVFMT